jgi:hypothetical protein
METSKSNQTPNDFFYGNRLAEETSAVCFEASGFTVCNGLSFN